MLDERLVDSWVEAQTKLARAEERVIAWKLKSQDPVPMNLATQVTACRDAADVLNDLVAPTLFSPHQHTVPGELI